MRNKGHRIVVYVVSFLLLLTLSPVCGFELLYRAALEPPPSIDRPQDDKIPASVVQALWLSYGESLPMEVTPLWAGNYDSRLRPTVMGRMTWFAARQHACLARRLHR